MMGAMKTSRRAFLRSSAAAAAAFAGGCLCRRGGGAPAPARIIDTHVHFYDPSRPQGVPWPPKGDALLCRRTLPDDYRAQPVPQRADGVVAVEASPWVEDNQWILDLAARDPLIKGFVGNLPVGADAFAGHLARFAANPLFRGVRIREGSLAAGLQDRAFMRDMRDIAGRGLCFDVHSPTAWAEQAAPLARAVSDLRLVVNHVANAPVTGGPPPAAWTELMKRLAEQPNVFMKVSGLVEGSKRMKGDAPAIVDYYRSVLDALWDIFGSDRLIYGSNWPVCGRYAPLATVQRIALDYFTSKGQAALDKVFWQNALGVYGCRMT